MKRIPFIAGNWKMNMTLDQAKELVLSISYGLKFPGEVDVVVAPPFTALYYVSNLLKDSYIDVAGQNIHQNNQGAFTGEVSGDFIKDAGANFVIIGHSERRQYYLESDELIGKKITASIKSDLIPILCIGETLEQRESGDFFNVIQNQLSGALSLFCESELKNIIIAYEPVWAIGTGKIATSTQIDEVHFFIRQVLQELFSINLSNQVRILYGGSVKPANSKEILSLKNVDGALVGGASLKATDFISIIKSAVG